MRDKRLWIGALILIAGAGLMVFLQQCSRSTEPADNSPTNTASEDSPAASPEEVIAELDTGSATESADTSNPLPLQLELISPEGETFERRQARMYNARITNQQRYVGSQVRCNWDFYLNENNEEALYQEMDNRSLIHSDRDTLCGFTSTFIEKRGVVRAVLTIEIYNATGVLDTVSAERTWTVL